MRRVLAGLLFTILVAPVLAQSVTVGACTGYMPVLSSGIQAKVSPGGSNRIRQSPGLDAARIGEMPPGSVFSVLYGPACADQYTWWLIRYQNLTGWTAEGEGTTHWLQPATAQSHAPKQPPDSLAGTSASVLYAAEVCFGFGNSELFARFADGTESMLSDGITLVLGQDSLRVEPGICVPPGLGNEAVAVTPFGVEMAPDVLALDTVDAERITLPDLAYTIPGMWAIRIRNYVYTIDIRAPSEPFMQGLYASDGTYRIILGGFVPNERIVIVTSGTTADAVGYTPAPEEVETTVDVTSGLTEIVLDPAVISVIEDMTVVDRSEILTRPEFVISPDVTVELSGALTALESVAVEEVSRLVFNQIDDVDVSILDDLGMTAGTGSTGGIFGLTFQDFDGTEVTADANGFAFVTVRLDGLPLGAIGQSGALAIWPNLAALYVPGGDAAALAQTLLDAYWAVDESAPTTCTYIVASGDTLNRIARSYNITLGELLDANPHVTNPDVIFRGLVLTIPNCSP